MSLVFSAIHREQVYLSCAQVFILESYLSTNALILGT
jgi:hypothetical protein